MAAVALTPEHETELRGLGIQDSKKYGSGGKAKTARLKARPWIYQRCHCAVLIFEPAEIDTYVERGALDDLERRGALELLKMLEATSEDHIVCDGAPIFGCLSSEWPNLIAENKADTKHVSVSAASIVAKTTRDEEMDRILARYEPEYGKITGGGYVNKGTRQFLEAFEAKHGRLPFEARKSWTWRKKPEVIEGPNIMDLLNGSET